MDIGSHPTSISVIKEAGLISITKINLRADGNSRGFNGMNITIKLGTAYELTSGSSNRHIAKIFNDKGLA